MFFDRFIGGFHFFSRFCADADNCSIGGTMSVPLFQQVAGSFQRDVLLAVQVRHLRLDFRPVLHRLARFVWKLGTGFFATAGAFLDFCPMLCDFDFHRRHIEYLPLFFSDRFPPLHRVPAMRTRFHPMDADMSWPLYHLQRFAFVSDLPSASAPRTFPQAFRRRLVVSVAGGWFAAVAAVLCQLVFQFLDTLCQCQKRRLTQQNHRLFSFLIGGANFFFPWQLDCAH